MTPSSAPAGGESWRGRIPPDGPWKMIAAHEGHWKSPDSSQAGSKTVQKSVARLSRT